ncbi:Sterol uptake control protein 2 [Paramyrothecium foliicola]|nr:Sterol uptake control protein 2 [Paramyrothecium foliicola]
MSGHGTTFLYGNNYNRPDPYSVTRPSGFPILAMDMSNLHPSLLNYPEPEPGEFDFGFLQPEEVQFQEPLTAHTLSDSSGRATPPSSENRHSSLNTSGSELVSQPPTQRQRLERRGHTKSRRGCYNCKRRRIKCQESRPACGHCVKTGLKCEYPALPQITHQPHHQIPLFSLQDMRFFQHFLTQCIPHHPLKQEDIWTHEIPCIAHNHEFLMHAILGYAATQLVPSDSSLLAPAMTHRIKAVRAIKKRLSEASRLSTSHEEANAMIAACFALTFQSVGFEDGLAEFMTFVRGIVVVGMHMMFKGIKPLFSNLMQQEQDSILGPVMEGLPLAQKGWADAAVESIGNLQPLCIGPLESDYQPRLMEIAQKLYTSSFDAYKQNSQHWAWWMFLPHNVFQELINPANQVVLLLHTHWLALSEMMSFISQQEYLVRDEKVPKSENIEGRIDPGFGRWLRYLNARVDYEHQVYNQWPMWVEEQLDRDASFFGKLQ